MLQEPKYDFQNGKVINRVSGEAIPDDEPIFILRGRDHHAADIIHNYANCCENTEHRNSVLMRVKQFEEFKENNLERMKEPDTDSSGPEWK